MASLSAVASDQWGMLTAAQARRVGVSRVDVNRLVKDGTLEPVPGAARVYRLTGVPEDPDQDAVRAAWLQLGQARLWDERVRDGDAIVSHRSAAHVRNLGGLIPRVHEFYVPTRVRLRRTDLRLSIRPGIARSDWSLSGGLPVCTIEKMVADLLADHEDESAVAQIVQDGIREGLFGRDELEQVVARYGIDYGYRSSTDFVKVLSGRQE
ncbi:MAG: hypothetical protein QOE58_3574 [Actinomycetota bacterium]|jgi:hypothetical protein|nr:hypothetical protein [Actinomycetota bacterium]